MGRFVFRQPLSAVVAALPDTATGSLPAPYGVRRASAPFTVLVLLIVSLLFCSGCVRVEDSLTLHADGSGEIVIRSLPDAQLRKKLPANLFRPNQWGMEGDGCFYPPQSQAQTALLFPPDLFSDLVFTSETRDGEKWLVAKAKFRSVAQLQESPYGRLHNLSISRAEGKLTVAGSCFTSGVALLQDTIAARKQTNAGAIAPGERGPTKEQFDELAGSAETSFAIILPAPVTAEGAQTQGATATRQIAGKSAGATFGAELMRPFTVSCSDAEVQFTPIPTLRPGLWPLNRYQEGMTSSNAAAKESEVLAAVRVLPLKVQINYFFAYLSKASGATTGVTIQACVTLPQSLRTCRLGKVTLMEAEDSLGESLVPAEQNRHVYFNHQTNRSPHASGPGELNHPFSIRLRAPRNGARFARLVRGNIQVGFTQPTLYILKDALPLAKPASPRNGELAPPALRELGVSLNVGAPDVPGTAYVHLNQNGDGSSPVPTIATLALYDTAGNPVPTLAPNLGGGGSYYSLRFSPTAARPLTLVLVVDAPMKGAAITVPFEWKDLPLFPPAAPMAADVASGKGENAEADGTPSADSGAKKSGTAGKATEETK